MEYSIRSGSNPIKIELNDKGDYIAVHPDNAKMFENFAIGQEKIMSLVESMPKRLEEIEREYKGKDDEKSQDEKDKKVTQEYVYFSEEFISAADGIFGSGTIHKYFIHHYEEIYDFMPGIDCALDFFEQITPAMEQIFSKHLEKRRAIMNKYRPQDHKRKGAK